MNIKLEQLKKAVDDAYDDADAARAAYWKAGQDKAAAYAAIEAARAACEAYDKARQELKDYVEEYGL
tara:strand:- start:261 stop:461 length:201 start_codon:yes stop_codon:yes gene_type:complete